MDFGDELEKMALVATQPEKEITREDVQRWQRLFRCSPTQARASIEAFRNDIARTSISDELWDTISSTIESDGYDREAYEYSLSLQPRTSKDDRCVSTEQNASFLVKLEAPIDTPERLSVAAGLDTVPTSTCGDGEFDQAEFCEVSFNGKQRLVQWLAIRSPFFRPTIIRIAKSAKDLCSYSAAPTLGLEATLPHNREDLDFANHVTSPAQNEYPVWYFFYGTLMDPADLSRQISLDDEPALIDAHVEGGRLRAWGPYKAIVNGESFDKVQGKAFLVQSQEEEDALRIREGDVYEVVRCSINFTNGCAVKGLTFRYCGPPNQLS
ncbi:hypothetical protein H2200_010974 [Cladophialophora chaetospira]|uniref:Putative gamma-glutamylcyclotransferase n=1 Tax=Cladophialophora chaetospira TaxID=386627 RepID=A0AA38X149_9EURO|nr:hypothetical protein H2200_010974 [Cladophialophora chaetospira]